MSAVQQMMLGSGRSKSVVYVTNVSDDSIGDDPLTFAATAISDPDATRRIVLGIGTTGNAVSSVTVGGVSATKIADAGLAHKTMWIAAVTTGTTADIVIDLASASGPIVVGVWATYGLTSSTPVDTDTSAGVNPSEATLTTVANGFCIAFAYTNTSTTSTWSSVTERFDTDVTSVGTGADGSTTGSDITPSCLFASSAGSESGVFATF